MLFIPMMTIMTLASSQDCTHGQKLDVIIPKCSSLKIINSAPNLTSKKNFLHFQLTLPQPFYNLPPTLPHSHLDSLVYHLIPPAKSLNTPPPPACPFPFPGETNLRGSQWLMPARPALRKLGSSKGDPRPQGPWMT